VNAWLKTVLADAARAKRLKENWTQYLLAEFDATDEQVRNLAHVPPEHAAELKRAIEMVVDGGGSIRLERHSEPGPGKLIVEPTIEQPKTPGQVTPALSVGVFHCTFDAHCRNWHCGWGPAL
jgi:hypothetical protein